MKNSVPKTKERKLRLRQSLETYVMTYQETEILFQKYLNGETTAEEEQLLALEVSRKDAPSDWKIIAEMLGELAIDEALFDKIMAERKPKPRLVRFWPWVTAACVAILLGIFLGPPREDTVSNSQIAKVEPKPEVAEEPKAVEPQKTVKSDVSTKPQPTHKTRQKSRVSRKAAKEQRKSSIKQETNLIAKAETPEEGKPQEYVVDETPAVTEREVAMVEGNTIESEPEVLLDRDLPITSLENFRLTKEEQALIVRLENEDFLKQIKQELEIAKYNQKQMAIN